jgi:hypothetical protein
MQRNKYNYFTPISQRTHSLLLELEKDNKETEENNEILNDKKNINNNSKNSIYSNNFEPLIRKLESQEDERFKKSRFLQFIKDINSNKLIIDEENNIIKQNPKYKEDDKEENKDGNNENNINEFEELLNQIKTYMNYSREDLAKNLLEQIFNNSKIKLKENQKYLEKAYLFLILCY